MRLRPTAKMLSVSAAAMICAALLHPPAFAHAATSFVSPDQVNLVMVLPDPPAPDSAQTKAELAELHQIAATRSDAEAAHAKADSKEKDVFIYTPVLGDGFSAAKLPAVAALFEHVNDDGNAIYKAAKKAFHRDRPNALDPSLKRDTDGKDFSYPSGHATRGWLDADILVTLVPSQRSAIFARAQDYAYSRLVEQAHYRSDLVAGQVSAAVIAEAIEQSPEFRKEYAAAQSELAAAGIK